MPEPEPNEFNLGHAMADVLAMRKELDAAQRLARIHWLVAEWTRARYGAGDAARVAECGRELEALGIPYPHRVAEPAYRPARIGGADA